MTINEHTDGTTTVQLHDDEYEITYNGYKGLQLDTMTDEEKRESAYSTWNVYLWVDNEYNIYKDKCEWIKNCYQRVSGITPEACRNFVNQYFPNGTPDFEQDNNGPIYGDIELVNWQEIADEWLIEAKELIDYDQEQSDASRRDSR